MARNLQNRLRLIQTMKLADTKPKPAQTEYAMPGAMQSLSAFKAHGWQQMGQLVLHRELLHDLPVSIPACLPAALPILAPDLNRCSAPQRPTPGDFLFFDLETTGLSGGAGTIAFLAAFGRLKNNGILHITQYLLLDYPGEYDFIVSILQEINAKKIIMVSYNGKSFDSQILKTRCLMNGIASPEYSHVDLLHPARRLWKTVLPDCSQGTIEKLVCDIDRGCDTPGSQAPDIWFSFLKGGGTEALAGICDHNRRDIAGLASIFAVFCRIARDPCGAADQYRCDIERLALRWRDVMRKKNQNTEGYGELQITGKKLLQLAAGRGGSHAAYFYALDLLRAGDDEGRERLLRITSDEKFSADLRAAAFRAMAIDSERRLKDTSLALNMAQAALALLPPGSRLLDEYKRRVCRLQPYNSGLLPELKLQSRMLK